MAKTFNILGFAGSLRKASFNRDLLRAAAELAPAGSKIDVFELEGIPPFNQDLEQSPPDIVKDFKAKVRASDAILIVTPEYNYGVPGVLKNAIDWASRPYGDNAFEGKPVAVMSASIGMLGGARAQYHLRQSFVFLNMYPVNRPEVMVAFADQKFDQNGQLKDEQAKKLIVGLLQTLIAFTEKLKP
ncbi:MAG: NAD(P)H-dependent oxidoreductase [Dehalococcoidia bacterium]|nr:NAD(P)H-dependent oxidoreductase [Dehalococcoidia bacterium]